MTGDHFGYGNPEHAGGPSGGRAARAFTWDCRQQPPMDDIARAVAELSGGAVRLQPVPTGTQDYALVVADHDVSDAEAEYLLYGGQS